MKCSKCGQELPNDSVFCHYCGTKLEAQAPKRYCQYCGNPIDSITNTCTCCSKQFFKLVKARKAKPIIISLALIVLLLVGANVYLYQEAQSNIAEYEGMVGEMDKFLSYLEAERDNAKAEYESYKTKAENFDAVQVHMQSDPSASTSFDFNKTDFHPYIITLDHDSKKSVRIEVRRQKSSELNVELSDPTVASTSISKKPVEEIYATQFSYVDFTPLNPGITTARFTNSLSSDEFTVLIIVV